MERSVLHKCLIVLIGICVLLSGSGTGTSLGQVRAAVQEEKVDVENLTWIIQWTEAPSPDFWADSEVLHYYEQSHVTVARPRAGLAHEEWVERWSSHQAVESLQPNQKVRAARAPNDPLLSKQSYLSQIRAEAAWDTAVSSNLTIAVVDTGVDRTHSDLADRLVPGYNLISPGSPPDDDNGHGTNVAGVLAAIANNDIGTAGLLWNAKIMPIKALESDGNGDEDKLGEGIRYAINHGAKIVVLSLGLNKYSSYMANIVQEAEDKGVLLVAASGNEGNAVKYPAAYDTVLAVGGATEDNKPHRLSNTGPELDLVAPWMVFTTSLGGTYGYKDGTSMAAPQAAAVAALAWSVRPGMTPSGIRNLLRQTAQDLGQSGWDDQTGYGLLRADRAVKEAPKRDFFESNDRQGGAKAIPSNKSIQAYLESGEEDWYYWDAPYDGVAHYRLTGGDSSFDLVHVPELTREEQSLGAEVLGAGTDVEVKKGRHYVKIASAGGSASSYSLYVDFRMYRDAFEDNNRQYKSYMLPARSQLLVGTFDQYQDQDWFSMMVDQSGTLKLKLSTDTARMDPVLSVIRKGSREVTIDHNGDGQSESYQVDVTPGQYYFKIANLSTYAYPVLGEYMLDLHLATAYEDPYEPNDKSYQATVLQFGDNYFGVIDPETDSDWYRIKLDGDSLVHVELGPVPESGGLQLQLLDGSLRSRNLPITVQDNNLWTSEVELAGGTYYLKLSSSSGQRQQFYGVRVHVNRMVGGFSDIYGHWAEPAMLKLVNQGYVSGYGYGNLNLYPNRPITRAEASAVLDRILQPGSAPPPGFEDVPSDHWAYPAIARLTRAGIISGYSRTTFAPDRNISRMEMMTLLANATGKKGYARGAAPFPDVSSSYWGAPILRQLKAEGWADGYEDGTFRPERLATRAEFMAFTVKMLELQ